MRNWDALSHATQHRYERAGVSRADYESGASLKAARGHAQTPERPEQAERHPEQFQAYTGLRNEIRALKRELYGSNSKFIDRRPTGSRAHLEKLRDALESKRDYNGSWEDFWDDHPEYDRDDYAEATYYH